MADNTETHTHTSWADTLREAAGTLVVAAILATFTLGGTAWVSVISMDNDITFLKEQAAEGGRHTAGMQKNHVTIMELVVEGLKEDIDDMKQHDRETAHKIDTHLRLSDKKVSEYDLKIQTLLNDVEECKKKTK